MRRVIGFLTAAAVVLAALPAQASGAALKDISSHWARPQIVTGISAGYIAGYPDGSFKPDAAITRAEFHKLLGAAMRLGPSQIQTGFSEESAANVHWAFAQGHIQASVSAGLLNPPDYGATLQGDQPISRREIVMATVRALGMAEMAKANQTLSTPDAAAYEQWLRNFAAVALQEGIITGYEDKSLGLGRTATRAEALVMVQRVLGKLTVQVAPEEAGAAAQVRHPAEGEPTWSLEAGKLIRTDNGAVQEIALPAGATGLQLLPAPGQAVWVRYSAAGAGVIARYAAGQWTEVGRYHGATPALLTVGDDGRLWFTNGVSGLMSADRTGKVWTINGISERIRFGAVDWHDQFWGLGGGTLFRVTTDGAVAAIAADLPAGAQVDFFTLGEDSTAWVLTRPAAAGGVKAEALQLRDGQIVRRVPLLGRYYGGLDAQASLKVVGQSGPFLWVSGLTGGQEDGLFRLDLNSGAFARMVMPVQVGASQQAQPAPGGGALVRDAAGKFWRVVH